MFVVIISRVLNMLASFSRYTPIFDHVEHGYEIRLSLGSLVLSILEIYGIWGIFQLLLLVNHSHALGERKNFKNTFYASIYIEIPKLIGRKMQIRPSLLSSLLSY